MRAHNDTEPSIQLLDSALAYAKIGWHITPLNGKTPFMKNWTNTATTDVRTLRSWFKDQHNIGIVTGKKSGIVTLDIDPRNGGDWTLRMLEKELGKLPETISAKTGGGGKHLIFKYFDGAKSTSKQKGIDFLVDGKQFVAAPSIHPETGCVYEWEVSPFDMEPAELPVSWKNKFCMTPQQAIDDAENDASDILEGDRNNELTSRAGKFYAQNITGKALEIKLLEENTLYCKPPLTAEEVMKIVKSVQRYNTKKSIKTQWQEAVFDSDLGKITKLILLAIARYANKEGKACFPAQQTIAECASVSLKTAQTHIALAIQQGWLHAYKIPRSGQGFHYGYMLKIKDV